MLSHPIQAAKELNTTLKSVTSLARFEFTDAQKQSTVAALEAESNWPLWLEQIEQHGLSGVANNHLIDLGLSVPADIRLNLKALTMRHKAAATARMEVLDMIANAFQNNDVDFLALKGVALLPKLYLKPELRPMRDMDLLVPKEHQQKAAQCLRKLGFQLPFEQPSKFMRFTHQLPNATLEYKGFINSVEIHHNAFGNDVAGKLPYPRSSAMLQELIWEGSKFNAFDDLTMLHQVARHLEGQHPGGVLKLVNVMDVIGLASQLEQNGLWAELEERFPHVICTLKCLHLLTPLPENLLIRLRPSNTKLPSGIGVIMESFTVALTGNKSFKQRVQLLLSPSDWWLHLHYNVPPESSIWAVKLLRHPLRVCLAFCQRAVSALMGG